MTARELAGDLHPVLRRLRETEPVSWLPALDGWLVTRADLAERVLRAPADFTVDDPRFTTARIVGPSMLSLDGQAHRQHRDPFARALRSAATRSRLAEAAASKARELVTVLASGDPRGSRRRCRGGRERGTRTASARADGGKPGRRADAGKAETRALTPGGGPGLPGQLSCAGAWPVSSR